MVKRHSVLRATVTKFLPGASALIATLLGIAVARGIALDPRSPLIFGIEVCSLCIGYASVLGAMGRRLAATAAPNGRRSFVAGLAATAFLLLVTELPGAWSLWRLALASRATGAASAGLMFFPWLAPSAAGEREILTSAPASSNEEL